jgi:hypothetical protein
MVFLTERHAQHAAVAVSWMVKKHQPSNETSGGAKANAGELYLR